MNSINVNDVLLKMIGAAKGKLQEHWEAAAPFAEQQFKSLAENLALIVKLQREGTITKEQASYYLEIQKSSVRIVLLTIEGLGLLAVEAAINAALDIVKTAVNSAIGWDIL